MAVPGGALARGRVGFLLGCGASSPIFMLTRPAIALMLGHTTMPIREEHHERPDQAPCRSGRDDGKTADAAEVRQSGGRAAASEAAARCRLSSLLQVWLR